MNTIYDDDQGIVIFGPQGCGKSRNAEALRLHFGKARIVEAECDPAFVVPDDAIVLSSLPIEESACLNKVSYEWAMDDMAGSASQSVDRKKVQYQLGGLMSTFTYALQGAEHKAYQAVRALSKSGLADSDLFRELDEIAQRLETINRRVQDSQTIEITLDDVCDECDGSGKSYRRAPYAREFGWHACQACFHKSGQGKVKSECDDPWVFLIGGYLDHPENKDKERFTAAEILINACKRDAGHLQRSDQHRIAPLMKSLGWTSSRQRTEVNGKIKQSRVYIRPGFNNALAVGGFAPDVGD